MIKKQLMATLLLLLGALPSFALGMHLGVRGEGAITRGYGEIGLYDFVGTFVNTNTAAVRSINQKVQFSGAIGLFAQLEFVSWYTLMPEVKIAFNRGLSYSGNYRSDAIVGAPDYIELTGEMSYGWTAIDINLINQFNLIRPNKVISIHALAGPAMSVILGNVKERFRPDFGGENPDALATDTNRPFNQGYADSLKPSRRFNVGITAGLGADFDFGQAGRLSFDVRTTWYFVPQIYTYPSPTHRVQISLPISINLGYAFKIF